MVATTTYYAIAKILSLAGAAFLIVVAVFNCLKFGTTTDVSYYIITIYYFIFALMMIIAELGVEKFVRFFSFMKGRMGRGLFYVFVGLLLFDWSTALPFICSLCLLSVGVINFIIGCRPAVEA